MKFCNYISILWLVFVSIAPQYFDPTFALNMSKQQSFKPDHYKISKCSLKEMLLYVI